MSEIENLSDYGVTEVLDYEGNDADKTFILKHEHAIRDLRLHWLREKRDEWEWVRDSKIGTPYVTIKYK